jgi:hypothetical protein
VQEISKTRNRTERVIGKAVSTKSAQEQVGVKYVANSNTSVRSSRSEERSDERQFSNSTESSQKETENNFHSVRDNFFTSQASKGEAGESESIGSRDLQDDTSIRGISNSGSGWTGYAIGHGILERVSNSTPSESGGRFESVRGILGKRGDDTKSILDNPADDFTHNSSIDGYVSKPKRKRRTKAEMALDALKGKL